MSADLVARAGAAEAQPPAAGLPTGGPGATAVPFARVTISAEARAAADRVLESGWVTTGQESAEFEREFAAYLGARNAVAVSSCTAALELSLRALRLPAGSRVLVPAITFCGVAHAVLHAGLVPALVDVDPATAMPTEATLASAARGCRPAALISLHYGGYPVPTDRWAAAAGLPVSAVIEDAAHGLGTHVGNRPVGTLGRASCFSFYATKNLPIGEGGMVTTEDDELAGWVRRTRLHGMSADAWRRYLPGGGWRYSVEDVGLKANLTDLQAAIGRAQLGHFDAWQADRARLAARYTAALEAVPGLLLPHEPKSGRHAWHLYGVQVLSGYGRGRDELIEALGLAGIGTSVHFIPLHHLPYFRRRAVPPPGGLPGADAAFARLLSLPLYPQLSDASVDRVAEAISAFGRPPRPHRARRPERTGQTTTTSGS